MITASICTIGDEILIGQIIDTNSSKIAIALNSIGVQVTDMISIGDNEVEIKETISKCLKKSSIVIITGGLGPTKDDITKKCLAELTGSKKFVCNEEQLSVVYKILNARGIEVFDINKAQAMVPDTCQVLVNERGTAPNMMFIIPEENIGHKGVLFSLPGVPFEAEAAIPKVINAIKKEFTLSDIIHRTICTFGIPESTLSKKIDIWENNLPKELHLAYLPDPLLGVRLRLSAYNTDSQEITRIIDEEIQKLKLIIGDAIYGYGDTSLPKIIGEKLKSCGKTLCSAESCTGGLVSSLITSISGASEYFYGGIVSYNNSVKISELNVPEEIIDNYGAVSKECVEAMAKGALAVMKTDYSVATSGIAGPTGGTKDKPVGTVWIAVADKKSVISIKGVYNGDRTTNIKRFASQALNLLRIRITQ